MILHRLSHVGTHAFPRDKIELDFDALPPLIAVVGVNGAGKTTLLDCVAAAMTGEMAYRPGSLVRNFIAAGGIELAWSMGDARHRSVLKVDPVGQRTEGMLYRDDAPISGPLIRDFRRAVREIVGPPDTLLASIYAVQSGAGSFLKAARADRRAVMAELLGLLRYRTLETAAKDRGRGAEASLSQARGRVGALRPLAEARVALEAEKALLEADRDATVKIAEVAGARVQQARVEAEDARARLAALTPVRDRVEALGWEVSGLKTQVEDAERRLTETRAVLSREAEVADAASRRDAAAAEIAAVDQEIQAGQAEAERIREAMHQAKMLALDVDPGRARVADLRHRASLIDAVPCGGRDAFAGCRLLRDAFDARASVAEAEAAVTMLEQRAQAVVVPNPTTDVAAARSRWKDAKRELDAVASVLALEKDVVAAKARAREIEAMLARLVADRDAKAEEHARLMRQVADLEAVASAVRDAEAALADADACATAANDAVVYASMELGKALARYDAAVAAERDLAEAVTQEAAAATDVLDWALIARAMGPTGIPALRVDRALPEIGTLATDLLRECYGEEVFSIRLTTQKESSDGDKMLETMDVVVSRGDEPVDAALLSGGESVLASEALSLAFALYAAGRSGRQYGTLLRDEVAAPLHPDAAPRYVRMLRRAAQVGRFRHVLFVTHHLRCAELADAVLEVGDGKVTVR